ncbi:hypothetical protein RJ640_016705 [Escallonia rubra]|uniref:Serine-threonine/tyrosine-protein kinase catalytic domain-containing protein n=1 Tax=Escallonia rubra TaxID=112253 RepID=A0AA88U7J1_9ASTE|nr:hypothetical protein RJ640_016705 [Escallonia rubra]
MSRRWKRVMGNLIVVLVVVIAEGGVKRGEWEEEEEGGLAMDKGGRGASAMVYRGTLRDETNVVVKRWNSVSGRGLKALRSEIGVLSRFRHWYVVSLIGYCDDRELALVHRMLH